MATLHIRGVPEAVAETLKSRAAAHGQPLSAHVNAQLASTAAQPSNAEIVARLRTRDRGDGVPTQRILDEIQARHR